MESTVSVRLAVSESQYVTGVSRATKATDELDKSVTKMATSSKDLERLGRVGVYVGGAIVASFGLGTRSAIQFEQTMRNVNSISGLSEENFRGLERSVRELALRTPQSAKELAEGLYDIASSGFQGAQGVQILEQSARAATAGLSTTATAAQAIVAALNAYGMSAKDAGDVSDILFQTVNDGIGSFSQFAGTMGDWVGAASAVGIPLDEASAALATMTVNAVGVEEAGTALNRVLLAFVQPSTAMTDALHKIGAESGTAALQTKGLRGTMTELAAAGFDNIDALSALFPHVIGLRGALALLAGDGANYARVSEDIADKVKRAGATQRAFGEQSKSTAVQLGLLKNDLTDLGMTAGDLVIPVLRTVASSTRDALDGFRAMPQAAQTSAIALTGLGGAVSLVGGGLLVMAPRIQQTMESFNALAERAPRVASAFRGVTAATGVVSIATAAATIIYGALTEEKRKVEDVSRDLVGVLEQEREGVEGATDAWIAQRIVHDDIDKLAKRAGVSLGTVTAAIKGNREALDEITGKDPGALAAGLGYGDDQARNDLANKIRTLSEGYGMASDQADRQRAAEEALGISATSTTGAMDSQTQSLLTQSGAFGSASEQVDQFTQSLDNARSAVFGVDQSTDKFTTDLGSWVDDITSARKEGDKFATSLAATSVAGLQNREALRGLVDDALDVAKAMKAGGKGPSEIAAGMYVLRQSLLDTADKMGIPRGEAEKFVNVLQQIDGLAPVADVFVNTDQAEAALQKLLSDLDGVLAISGDIGGIVATLVGSTPAIAPFAAPAVPTAAPTKMKDSETAVTDFLKATFDRRVEIAKNYFELTGNGQREYMKLLDEQLAHEVAYTDAWRQTMDERNRIAREGMRTQRMMFDTLTGGYFQAKPGEEAVRARAAMGAGPVQLAPSQQQAPIVVHVMQPASVEKNYNFGDVITATDIDGVLKEARRREADANLTQTGVGGSW